MINPNASMSVLTPNFAHRLKYTHDTKMAITELILSAFLRMAEAAKIIPWTPPWITHFPQKPVPKSVNVVRLVEGCAPHLS